MLLVVQIYTDNQVLHVYNSDDDNDAVAADIWRLLTTYSVPQAAFCVQYPFWCLSQEFTVRFELYNLYFTNKAYTAVTVNK